jgi:hypothetical protein
MEKARQRPLRTNNRPEVLGQRSAHGLLRNESSENEDQASDQDLYGGDDGTRTHDPLLAKNELSHFVTCTNG